MPVIASSLSAPSGCKEQALRRKAQPDGFMEAIYETQHAGTVPERAGARIRLLEAAIVFARRTEPGSSG
jgi:hypothetical protein